MSGENLLASLNLREEQKICHVQVFDFIREPWLVRRGGMQSGLGCCVSQAP